MHSSCKACFSKVFVEWSILAPLIFFFMAIFSSWSCFLRVTVFKYFCSLAPVLKSARNIVLGLRSRYGGDEEPGQTYGKPLGQSVNNLWVSQ